MKLLESVKELEASIIKELKSKQVGINDKTGKGNATERVVEERLLRPNLAPGFELCKGAVATPNAKKDQSAAIDRILYTETVAGPLVKDQDHSIFPIEAVVGCIEITMRLNPAKLRADVAHVAPVRALKERHYLEPIPGTTNQTLSVVEKNALGCRTYIVGLPADSNWDPKEIGQCLKDALMKSNTHIHGLYVLGIGLFEALPNNKKDAAGKPALRVHLGADRLFRFTTGFRMGMYRWPQLEPNVVGDMERYLPTNAAAM